MTLRSSFAGFAKYSDTTAVEYYQLGHFGMQAQQIAYAASITPELTAGQLIQVGTLTGNITVNNPTFGGAALTADLTGLEIIFEFTQGGAGGFAVLWGSLFATQRQINVGGPGAVTSVRFRWTGSQWIQADTQFISSMQTKLLQAQVGTAVTTDQTVTTTTLTAGALNVIGRGIRLTISGRYTTTTSQTPTLTFKIKIGSVTLVTFGPSAATTAASANNPWEMEVRIFTVSTGASGTVVAKGTMIAKIAGALTWFIDSTTAASSAIDLTASQQLLMTWTTSTGNASNKVQVDDYLAESLNAA